MPDRFTAGCRTIEVRDDERDATFPAVVLYPSTAPERATQFGPYTLDVAVDAPVAAARFPLVVVSHGTGSWHLLHRGLAAHLARAGFVVALPVHPRNNRNDDSLAGTHTILADRPRQIRAVIDRAYAEESLGAHLVPDTVAVIGHSLGGYTALAVAGGRPWAAPHETPDGSPWPVPVTPDARVKALVLLAPATPWYLAPGALRDVRAAVLVYAGARDVHAPPWHAELVVRGVSSDARVDYRLVPDAGHFSFLAPFPAHMTRPEFAPSQDPPGFDRAAFHARMYYEVEAFLRGVLRVTRA